MYTSRLHATNGVVTLDFDALSGELLAFMAQNPNVMGSKAIEAAVALMEGTALSETNVDTGVSVVTKDNVADFND